MDVYTVILQQTVRGAKVDTFMRIISAYNAPKIVVFVQIDSIALAVNHNLFCKMVDAKNRKHLMDQIYG